MSRPSWKRLFESNGVKVLDANKILLQCVACGRRFSRKLQSLENPVSRDCRCPRGCITVGLRSGEPVSLVFLGDKMSRGGTYVLRIFVEQPVTVYFRKRGKWITVPAGNHVYVGSALENPHDKFPRALAQRLVRHASRINGQHHFIRQLMIAEFSLLRLGPLDRLVNIKKPSDGWNVDYLLENPLSRLAAAFLLRHPPPEKPVGRRHTIEAKVGRFIQNDPAADIFEEGLGAGDIKGNTHLLRIDADEKWWQDLPRRLERLLLDELSTKDGAKRGAARHLSLRQRERKSKENTSISTGIRP